MQDIHDLPVDSALHDRVCKFYHYAAGKGRPGEQFVGKRICCDTAVHGQLLQEAGIGSLERGSMPLLNPLSGNATALFIFFHQVLVWTYCGVPFPKKRDLPYRFQETTATNKSDFYSSYASPVVLRRFLP